MKLRPWAIGLFIVIGFVLFTATLFLIGNRHKAFDRHITVYTEFANLGGLADGAKVRVSGLDAGELKKIEIPERASGRYRLQLQIEQKVHGLLRMDSVASIETEGVVGDKYLSVKKGTDDSPEAEQGATLPSKEPFDLGALMDKSTGLLNDVHGTVNDLHTRLNTTLDSINRTVNHGDSMITDLKPHMEKIVSDGGRITGKVDSLVTGLNAGQGPAGMLLKDPQTEQQLRTTIANAQQISVNVNQAAARADETIEDFQNRQLLANAQVTLDNVQALSIELNTQVKSALAQDSLGQDGAANLRQTLSNLNRGTANLADDTEALKHNFFFRGFFKKRGFYNLDEITPAEYAQACKRANCSGSRTWLDAPNLFVLDSDGKEQLSEAGRLHIDNEVAPEVNSLLSHIVVVEGFATGGTADQQYVESRRRADLVRRYLELHYHLNHSNVGIVAMKDQMPAGASMDHWNGVAIGLVEGKPKK